MPASSFRGLIMIVILIITSAAFAQNAANPSASMSVSLPTVIRISGTIDDAAALKSGTAGVVFLLYASETSTSPLWAESQSLKFDASGHYSTLLGANTVEGVPMDLFASGEARWLGFSIDGREQKRLQLVSVPYALKAKEAETLNGLTAHDIAAQAAAMSIQGKGPLKSGSSQDTSISLRTASAPLNHAAINTTATNFTDATTSPVVNVSQRGTGSALQAATASTTSNAILGINTALTGAVRGVYGEANSTTSGSAGIFGTSKAATGATYGVLGVTSSTSGTALNGTALATTGNTIGLRGQANSVSGIGVQAASTAVSGATTGVNAFVLSPDGTAAIFDNRAGGNILSLRNNSVEKLSVDGAGNLTANFIENTPPMMIYQHASFSHASYSMGSGSINFGDGFFDMHTGSAIDSSLYVQDGGDGAMGFGRGLTKPGAFISARVRQAGATINNLQGFFLGAGDVFAGFGFQTFGTELYGRTRDSSGVVFVDLGISLLHDNTNASIYDLLAVRRASSVDFYVGGVFVGSLKTNLAESYPVGSYHIDLTNAGTGGDVELEVAYLTVGIPLN